jgi:glycosyltransferase involved in cell wall biosynthesis
MSTDNNWKLRVAVISKSTGFCYFYRLKWALAELEERGLIETLGVDWSSESFRKNKGEVMGEVITWADVIVFQYGNPSDIVSKFSDFITKERLPKLIVCEFDDDFTCVHPSNSYYRYAGLKEVKANGKWVWKDNDLCDYLNEYKDKTDQEKESYKFNINRNKVRLLKMFRACMYADVITTTTKELGSTFDNWNENIRVLPNYINPKVMPDGKKKKRDYTLIGWQGGDSHHHDLKMIMPALKRVKDRYRDKVHFRFMGAAFINMYKEIEGEHIGWVDPYKFYDAFSEDLLDIGLVPLVDPDINKFNKSKSNIKWLEYSYYGIPSVVSGYKPYVQHIEDWKTGIIAYTEDDWYRALCKLIDDPLYRIKLGSNAKTEVINNFNISTYAYKWYQLYMDALKTKVEYLNSL